MRVRITMCRDTMSLHERTYLLHCIHRLSNESKQNSCEQIFLYFRIKFTEPIRSKSIEMF